ncbi:Kelch repeat-containing protein [Geofilum rhodophaeum]|uniref:Kelch repeat-containing protein n=1 Tax=Geofilum rhodophaeum TaxID=1965019 RepID=UPI00197A73EF|nr:kelch repeat-containing protein [Geofilum rhodophaeum]
MMNLLKKSWLLLAVAGLSLGWVACGDDEEEDDAVGNWVRRSDFDGVARGQAAAFSLGQTGYLMGGYDGRDRLGDFWAYDAEQNFWTQKASFPGESRNSAVGFALNGKGYVGTGYNGLDYLSDFWAYDPANNIWEQKADYPGGGRYGAVAFSVGDYGFIGCGYNGNHLKDFYKYLPESDVWEQHPFPGTKRVGASAFNIGENVYLVGGINNQQYVYDFWKLNAADLSWEQKRDIANTSDDSYDDDYTIVRSYGVAFTMGSLGYYTTGESGSLRTDTWEYNPLTDLWVAKTDFEGAARSGAVAFSLGTEAFVATGRSSSYRFDDNYVFHPFEEYEAYD